MRTLLVLLALLCSACRSVNPAGARIDDVLTRMVPFGLSGSVLVADRDGVILSKGYGAGLRPDTIYDMGSITKSFTATAILLLEADGRLSIDDALAKHFTNVPPEKAEITLRQILTHSAGLVDLTGDDYDRVSREQLIADVFRAPLVSKPGAEFHYSNAGFSMLSAIIEQVSGKDYHTFMRERLFAPAGMRDTGYTLRSGAEPRVARTLTPPADHGTPWERLARSGGVHWVLLGNGGMLTTTEDLYRWELALRRGTIVPVTVQEKLFAPMFKRSDTVSVAAAWTRETVNGETAFHHGSDAPSLGVNGDYRRYPEAQLAVIFLGNTRVNGWSPRRVVGPLVRRIVRGESIEVPRVAPARDLARYAGTYTLSEGNTIDVRVDRDHLVFGMTGQDAVDLLTIQRNEPSLAARRQFNEKVIEVAKSFAWPEPLLDVAALGTSRRDRGAFMTTIRARFAGAERLYRVAWQQGGPVMESDDASLPHIDFFTESPIHFALERPFWRENAETFVFYDIYTGESIRAVFDGGSLMVRGTPASRRLAGRRPAALTPPISNQAAQP